MTTYRKIVLNDGCQLEAAAYEAITPGHLLDMRSDGTLIKHATAAGQKVLVRVALENTEVGNGITDAYAADDQVKYLTPDDGMILCMWLKNGENVVVNDELESAGDGTLQKKTTGKTVALAAEALHNTSGSAAMIAVVIAEGASFFVQQSAITALTDNSTGVASNTLAALSALSTAGGNTYTDAAVNARLTVIANALASLAAKVNALISADHSSGITA
jgi:hypothetical protein